LIGEQHCYRYLLANKLAAGPRNQNCCVSMEESDQANKSGALNKKRESALQRRN
jgi:hypothetical protein